jgi:hypothetical protein
MDPVAYLLTHFWPGGTEEEYRATIAAAHPGGGLPAGQIYHAAGPADGGYLVAAVWQSQAACDAFLAAALDQPVEGGLAGPPQERTAEVANLLEG